MCTSCYAAARACTKIIGPSHGVPVLQPHYPQITGVVGAVSWRRDIHNGVFQNLFPTVGNVSHHKPVRFALWPVDCGQRLSNLLCAIHPPAHFFNPVLANNFYLIFIVVRHMFSPMRRKCDAGWRMFLGNYIAHLSQVCFCKMFPLKESVVAVIARMLL